MRIWAWDIESLSNLFTATFVNIKTKEIKQFVAHSSKNTAVDMGWWIKNNVDGLVGYNSIDYDYKVVHPFLEADNPMDGDVLAKAIYKRSNQIINDEIEEGRLKPIVPQRDLFRIWHFNSKSKRVSLKFLQINMGIENVQEMPYKHTDTILEEQIQEILDYNYNDVLATIKFYELSKNKILLRKALSEKYGDLSNASDVKIGEQIFLKEMCKRTGRSEKSISSGRTPRPNMIIKDVLFDVNFSSDAFNKIYNKFKSLTIKDLKEDGKRLKKNKELTVVFDGMEYEFGFGGLHAYRRSGVYENIHSADVSSYYPNLAIGHNFYPKHLGPIYCEVYKGIYEERKKHKKGTPENEAYKLALNGAFGQSNAEWSLFFDTYYTLRTTVNGQLLLAQLCEMITTAGAGQIIMVNTDGIEVDVKKEDSFRKICDLWQKLNGLELEFSKYKKLCIRDSNAYIGLKDNGEVKEKNDFETKKEIFKDQSMRIVPLAVRKYFIDGIPVEKTINECEDIGLFLMGKRAHTGVLEYRKAVEDLEVTKLPKYVRYYISKSGGSIVKVTELTEKQKAKKKAPENQLDLFSVKKKTKEKQMKITAVHAGRRMTLFNKWVNRNFVEYGVDKSFYINEARKLISSVENTQSEI